MSLNPQPSVPESLGHCIWVEGMTWASPLMIRAALRDRGCLWTRVYTREQLVSPPKSIEVMFSFWGSRTRYDERPATDTGLSVLIKKKTSADQNWGVCGGTASLCGSRWSGGFGSAPGRGEARRDERWACRCPWGSAGCRECLHSSGVTLWPLRQAGHTLVHAESRDEADSGPCHAGHQSRVIYRAVTLLWFWSIEYV